MYATRTYRKTLLALCCFMSLTSALADPAEDEAVARARRDYANAMKTNDVGLQNAMRIELSVQLAKAKDRKAKNAVENGNAKLDNNENKKM